MAELKLVYAVATTPTVTGLATLSNGSSATSATQDNTSDLFLDALLELVITTATGSTTTGFVEIYIKGSIDNTDFDDDNNDKWAGSVTLGAAGPITRKRIVSVASCFGGSMPAFWQIRIKNSAGAALTAGTVQVRGVKAQTV